MRRLRPASGQSGQGGPPTGGPRRRGLPRPSARRLRRVVGALGTAIAVVVAPTAAAGAAVSAHAAGDAALTADTGVSAAAPSTGPMKVTLGSVTPSVPTAADTLTLAGTVRNAGTSTWLNVSPELAVGRALGNRSELDVTPSSTGQIVEAATTSAPTPALAPGASAPWTVSVPLATLQSDGFLSSPTGTDGDGVFPVTVLVTGSAAGSAEQLGSVRTFLPWMPHALPAGPLNVVMLWPLIDTPRLDGDSTLNPSSGVTTPELTDDSLTTDMTTGRLATLVQDGAAAGPGITWVVDPDLLDTAKAMEGGYVVPGASGPQPGTGSGAAQDWLASLTSAVGSGDEVDAVPTADPDLTAVAKVSTSPGLQQAVTAAAGGAVQDVASTLGRPAASLLAWPVDGVGTPATTAAAVNMLTPGGTKPVLVMSGNSLSPDANLTYTPSGRTNLDGATAVVSDAVMQNVLADEVNGGAGSGAVDTQRLLAETAMTSLEEPSVQRTILLAPPRRWSLTSGTFHDLTTLLKAPWLKPVALSALTGLTPPDVAWNGPVVPARSATALSPAYLQNVTAFDNGLNLFASILQEPGRVTTDAYGPAVVRGLSSAWRQPGGGVNGSFLSAASTALASLRSEVRIVGLSPQTTITLSGTTGTVPITVENDLRQSVKLQIRLESNRANRLTVTDPGLITLAPSRQTVVKITAKAKANGPVEVQVSLVTPQGLLLTSPQTFWVNVTRIGAIALAVGGVVGGLLVLTVVLRVLRRRRARRSKDPGDTGGEGPPPTAGGSPTDGSAAVTA